MLTHNKFMKKAAGGGEGTWLLTYGDLVTLLFAFFLIIAAMSTPDEQKYEELKEGLVKSVSKNTVVQKPIHQLFDELQKAIKSEHLETQVTAQMNKNGIKIEFSSGVLFKSGDADLMPEAYSILGKIVASFNKMSDKDFNVAIEGHTDNVPIKTAKFPSNWELSTARATNVLRVLITDGMAPSKLKASGLADIQPKAPNMDANGTPIPDNQMKNRRVVINVTR
jgi:chemotaxis protein MotB